MKKSVNFLCLLFGIFIFYFRDTCHQTIFLFIHINKFYAGSYSSQGRNTIDTDSDNNPACGDDHQFLAIFYCFYTHKIAGSFIEFIAFYTFSATVLNVEFTH